MLLDLSVTGNTVLQRLEVCISARQGSLVPFLSVNTSKEVDWYTFFFPCGCLVHDIDRLFNASKIANAVVAFVAIAVVNYFLFWVNTVIHVVDNAVDTVRDFLKSESSIALVVSPSDFFAGASFC